MGGVVGQLAAAAARYGIRRGMKAGGEKLLQVAQYVTRKRKAIPTRRNPVQRNRAANRRQINRLKKRVSRIQKEVRNAAVGTGTHVFRLISPGYVTLTVNQHTYGELVRRYQDLEAAMTAVRFYDANSNAIVTKDITGNAFSQDLNITGVYEKVTFRNNFNMPIHLKIWRVKAKVDSDISPKTAMTNGLTDIGNPDTDVRGGVYPTDSPQFNSLWKIHYTRQITLPPGRQKTFTSGERSFKYNPSLEDNHTTDYQVGHHASGWLYQIFGPVAHDFTTTTNTGFGDGRLDLNFYRVITFKYEAGAHIKTIELDTSNIDTLGAGPQVVSRPASDGSQVFSNEMAHPVEIIGPLGTGGQSTALRTTNYA